MTNSSPTIEEELVDVLHDFCQRLNQRLERYAEPVHDPVFAGDAGVPSMIYVFDKDIQLDRTMIGQKPHRFTGRYLVEPCLETLGYRYIPEPRGGLVEKQEIYPDFRLVPINENKDQIIIGELKNPGALGGASEQLKEYLIELSTIEFGIATDGIRWKLYQRSANSVQPTQPGQASLREVLHDIRQPLVHEDMDEKSEKQLHQGVERFVRIFQHPIDPHSD